MIRSKLLRALLPGAMAAAVLTAAPASAAEAPRCQYLVGNTPSAEVDTNGDGNPEVRVPSLRDVTLCVQGDVVIYDQRPLLDVHHCAEWLSCVAFRVTVGFGGSADAGMSLCYAVDTMPSCVSYDPGPIPVSAGLQTICVGYDLAGGHPCANGQMFALE